MENAPYKPIRVACGAPHVLEILAEEHALQRELCDLLEAIADGLPHTFDKSRATVAICLLEGSLPAHTRLEEDALFPLLARRLGADHPVTTTLSVLEDDHERESSLLVELAEALNEGISAPKPESGNALGYLLRGAFDAMRRHLDFEDRVVLPAARDSLTAEDHAWLQGWIMRSAHPRCCRQSLMALRKSKAAGALCGTCPSGVADPGPDDPINTHPLAYKDRKPS